VTWAEFRIDFHGHHIPASLMAHKLQEFLHSQQGLSSVYEYSKKFNHLYQYSSYHTDTDEKKMSLFRQGLSPMLREHLMLFWGCTPNELVSASIEQEDVCRAAWRRRGRRGLYLGLTLAFCPSTAWSTLCLQASYVVPLCRSSGATVYLIRWPHVL
jgi:hypothetical protein